MRSRPIALLPGLVILAIICARTTHASPELKGWLGSAYTLPGEETELWLTVTSDTRPDALPEPPASELITFKFLGDPIFPGTTQERTYVYRYGVVSYQEGNHPIPSFEIKIKGASLKSQPLKLHVAKLPEDAWFEHVIGGEKVQVASRVCLPGRTPFEGEATPAEVKIYLPVRFKVEKGSIAELAHDGVAAERFNISSLILPNNIHVTTARLRQQNYTGITYRSTITPLHDGQVSIGPGQGRLTVQTRGSSRGLTKPVLEPLEIPVEKRSFAARPLPQPAPEGFRNAVGRFTISSHAETNGLREEDPISLRLTVTGTGNLDTLAAPELTASPAEWKSYPAYRLPRNGARSDATGMATFSQVIRPNGLRDVVPPYRLVTFDPEGERYVTLTTPPIPIDLAPANAIVSPSATALPDLSTPVVEMEGILGLVDPLRNEASGRALLSQAWHILPALLASVLLFKLARRRFRSRLARPAREGELVKALAHLEGSGQDARQFLRASGSFVEQWIPMAARDEETNAVLKLRDENCYRQRDLDTRISREERSRILAHLRRRALDALGLVLLMAFIAPCTARAAEEPVSAQHPYVQAFEAWNTGDFLGAIDRYFDAHKDESLPADVLYNIGNCYFHLGERGLAMLYYRRALQRDTRHAEASQNMGFLERKTGAITIVRPEYQERLSSLPRLLYLNLTFAGGWIILISILAILLAKVRKRLSWTGLYAGLLCALAGGMGLFLYPSDLEFAPVEQQATMINSSPIIAGTEAATITEQGGSAQESRQVIEVPPGSLCRPLATRGPWTYVEFANDIRAWVPSKYVRLILPCRDERPPNPTAPA